MRSEPGAQTLLACHPASPSARAREADMPGGGLLEAVRGGWPCEARQWERTSCCRQKLKEACGGSLRQRQRRQHCRHERIARRCTLRVYTRSPFSFRYIIRCMAAERWRRCRGWRYELSVRIDCPRSRPRSDGSLFTPSMLADVLDCEIRSAEKRTKWPASARSLQLTAASRRVVA